jgi:outer membrane protein
MRVERIVGARAWLAALMIPALAVSAFGQTPPTAAQPPAAQTPPATTQPQQAPPMPALPSTEPPPQPTGPTKRLTLDEAVQSALEQNLTLQVQRIDPRVQDYAVAQARSVWLPSVVSSVSYQNADLVNNQSFVSGASALSTTATNGQAGFQQFLQTGGSYSATWNLGRATSTASSNVFNPSTSGSLNLQFSQPLLRNFSIDASRQNLLITKVNRQMSDIQLRQVVVGTVRNVKLGYWSLVGARSNLEVAQQSLDLSRQTLKDNQTRVEVGTMAPIDIVQAQAEVASNEEQVIVAQAAVQAAEDTLRTLIYDPQSPNFWTQHLEPSETPTLTTAQIDVDAAVKSALDKRTDLLQAAKLMEESQINIRYTKNQLLPAVNGQVTYGTNALGGASTSLTRSYGSVLGDVFSAAFPNWSVGVSVSYPLGQNNAQAGLARARLQYHESELQVRQLQMTVAQQVRDVVRRVNTNLKRIDATRAARELSERKLEAEQKKFAVGLSTSFQVVQAQRDLATARYNEVQAILDYTTSLADYEAVQETSVGTSTTGTGQITVAAASSNGSGSSSSSSSSSSSGR